MQQQTPMISQSGPPQPGPSLQDITPPLQPSTPLAPQEPVSPAPMPPKPPKREGLRSALSTILILIAAPIIAILLTSFVFQSYEVDGPSMETTLQNQDRLVVLKTGKTWSSLFNRDFIPKRGEIVVFSLSDEAEAGTEAGRQLIKRVIALPGERVVVKDGRLTVYNSQFPGGFSPDESEEYRNQVSPSTPGNLDITVPDGQVFVCGDNRSNSLDSRSFGPIPSKDIVGTLAMRLYPFSKFKTF